MLHASFKPRLVDELSKRATKLAPESRLEFLRRMAPSFRRCERQAAAEIFLSEEPQAPGGQLLLTTGT